MTLTVSDESAAELARIEGRMRKGVLGLAALAALAVEPAHGYALAQRLKAVLGLQVAEGTLYPLLAGFESQGWVETGWNTDRPGPARKVYAVTEPGRAALDRLAAAYRSLSADVEELLP
ncbi:MAG: PadR family transcriptional regulator [Oceanicaulis sp.]